MSRNVSTYEHFCTVARALEKLGDRWSLLVVRDLLSGPKRFTDLMDRLGGITPKTLTQRLRDLADSGVVVVDRKEGRREVWYSLTPAGQELGPVIDGLGLWGLRHAWRNPNAGEPLHAEHLLRAVVEAIESSSTDQRAALWRLVLDGDSYYVHSDGTHWTYGDGTPTGQPEVTVTARTEAFGRFALAGREGDVLIDGDAAATQRFRQLVGGIASVVAAA